jgi:hypothetical protein
MAELGQPPGSLVLDSSAIAFIVPLKNNLGHRRAPEERNLRPPKPPSHNVQEVSFIKMDFFSGRRCFHPEQDPMLVEIGCEYVCRNKCMCIFVSIYVCVMFLKEKGLIYQKYHTFKFP